MLNWYRHHWWWFGLAAGVIAAIVLVVGWDSFEVTQRVMLGGFIVLMLHEFEEWGWPGGEAAILNTVANESDAPDRYPSNANSAMVINVFVAYPLFLLAVFIPDAIFYGLFVAFIFWIGQFAVHGPVTTRQLGYPYNPGLATVIFAALPLGIYYVYYVHAHHMVSVWDWVGAVVCMAVFVYVFMLKLTFTWLADKNSPYHFTEAEMAKWNVESRRRPKPASQTSS